MKGSDIFNIFLFLMVCCFKLSATILFVEIKINDSADSLYENDVTNKRMSNYSFTIDSPWIKSYKRRTSVYFFQNKKRLNTTEIINILSDHPKALSEFKKGRSNNILSGIIGFAGGFLIGNAVAKSMIRNDIPFDTNRLMIGVGLAACSIPISLSANKQKLRAIEFYNNSLEEKKSLGFKEKVELIISPMKISMTF